MNPARARDRIARFRSQVQALRDPFATRLRRDMPVEALIDLDELERFLTGLELDLCDSPSELAPLETSL